MKILITTCGIGTGHASRDLALAEILELNNHEVEFASYGSGLEHLKRNRRKPYQLPKMNFDGENGEINIKNTAKQSKEIPFTFIKSMYKESRIIKKANPDIVITDSHYSSPITSKFLNIPCYIITNDLTFGFSENTNLKSIKYLESGIRKFITEISRGCQKILVPDIPGSIIIPEELKDKTNYIGPLLHQRSDEIPSKDELRIKYNQQLHEKIIVVTVGGSDFGRILIDNICELSDYIEADKIIIFTGVEIDPNTINLPNNSSKIQLKQFTYNLVEWMKLSDLTITLAGHTTSMELISITKPNIMIPIENHVEQKRNVKNMKKFNITRTCPINNKQQLLSTINATLNNVEYINVNKREYIKFKQYDGKDNALKLIENLNIK